MNHPFHQGNRRTAVALVISFLDVNGYWIRATQEAAVELGYHIGDGGWDVDRVDAWLRQHAVSLESGELPKRPATLGCGPLLLPVFSEV